LILLFVCFLIVIWRLFGLVFESGEIYPAYSSLRTDPLGAKAFYESLNSFKMLEVSRNYESFSKLSGGKNTTLILLGLKNDDLENTPKKIVDTLDRFVLEGGRLVLAFGPLPNKPYVLNREPKDKQKEDKTEKEEKKSWKEDDKSECPHDDCESVSLAIHWNLAINFAEKPKEGEEKRALRQGKSRLPASLSWHTVLYFDKIDKPWKAIYTVQDRPVIIEKPYGQGSIVIAADSYLFSNEAMRKERSPELLLWFIGPHAKMIFEETHFGINKSEGVATLVRRFRMQWFLIGFLLMAILFIWKQMTPFVPSRTRATHAQGDNVARGRDYISGLISLLRRNVNRQTVLKTCFQEWSASQDSIQKTTKEKREAIEHIVLTPHSKRKEENDPVQKYRTIHKILSQRRKA
jgi:hypothetical protein